jgi:nucleoside-diphosphate-sugar epimerase
MERKRAIVVGALGMIGRHVLQHLETRNDWDVIGVSRRRPTFATRAEFISVDLEDRQAAERKLGHLDDVTHVFYSALNGGIAAENVEGNLALVRNSVGVIAEASVRLRRVVLTQGGKYYGCHLGPHKTPSKETDPRHLPPNFYYDQQDCVASLQQGKSWTYTLVRPEAVVGSVTGIPLNTAGLLAAYAAICKQLDVPFHYPGPEAAFKAYNKFTDARLLGRFEAWCAVEPAAANEAFNITNESGFRWCNLWPTFTDYFGVRRGIVMPFSLADFMADKAPVWDAIVARHGIRPTPLSDMGDWAFADWNLGRTWDTILEDTKRIKYGFTEVMDSEESFLSTFDRMRADRLIP